MIWILPGLNVNGCLTLENFEKGVRKKKGK